MCYKIQCAAQVNSYPTVRGFTAIGTGGEDFVQAMVVAVESVIQQPIPQVYFIFLSRRFWKIGDWTYLLVKRLLTDALIYSMIQMTCVYWFSLY